MSIVDVKVFIVEDSQVTLDVLDENIRGYLINEMKDIFSAKFTVESTRFIDSIEDEIKKRYQQSKNGKCYLSVGILDLVNFSYPSKKIGGEGGNDRVPDTAIAILKRELVPYSEKYGFKFILVTNIFNYCRQKAIDPEFSPEEKKEINLKQNEIRGLIDRVVKPDFLIEKGKDDCFVIDKKVNEEDHYGEGTVDAAVIKKTENRLRLLIEEGINKYNCNFYGTACGEVKTHA